MDIIIPSPYLPFLHSQTCEYRAASLQPIGQNTVVTQVLPKLRLGKPGPEQWQMIHKLRNKNQALLRYVIKVQGGFLYSKS